MENTQTIDNSKKKSGRKRAILAAGSLLGIGALATSAYFTDFGLLDLNGGNGGFGGDANRYNLQFSNGQEDTIASVADWIEANPDAANVAPIDGADALVPGGEAVYAKLPVLNESPSLSSTLSLAFENLTPASADQAQAARDTAYAGLVRVSIAVVDDATSVPSTWLAENLALVGGEIPATVLPDLAAAAGKVVVVKIQLADGATQAATNAANGGTLDLQARFDGESRN